MSSRKELEYEGPLISDCHNINTVKYNVSWTSQALPTPAMLARATGLWQNTRLPRNMKRVS